LSWSVALQSLDAYYEDADELIRFIKQLTQPFGICHLMLVQELQPESAFFEFLKDDSRFA